MQEQYISIFAESLVEVLGMLTEQAASWKRADTQLPAITDQMIFVSLLGFAGAVKGRIVMEMDMEAGQAIGEAMNGESIKPYDKMLFHTLAELSNMFAGKAITVLNNRPDKPGLRLTPPSILVGENLSLFGEYDNLVSACVQWADMPVYIHLSMKKEG